MDLLRNDLLSRVARAPDTGGDAGAVGGGNEQSDAGGNAGQDDAQDFVTLADDGEDIVVGDDGDGEVEDQTGDGETEGKDGEGGEGEPKPDGARKRPSGSARLKARLRAAEEELAELRQMPAPRVPARDDDLVEPKESDFPNDYLAYERAMRAYETRKAIRDENRRVALEQSRANGERESRAKVRAYNARLDEVKDRIPDFDATLKAAAGTEIRDDVVGLILESAKGPLIAYHLARNPDRVEALNRMSPVEAAREIGRLEARIRGPQAKKITDAKTPIRPVRGGGGRTEKPLAEESVESYFARRNAEEGVK